MLSLRQSEPFAQYKRLTSLPHQLEGYIIDLLDELSKNTSLDFTVKAVADGKYGTMEGGRWNGMIGELTRDVRITCYFGFILTQNLRNNQCQKLSCN